MSESGNNEEQIVIRKNDIEKEAQETISISKEELVPTLGEPSIIISREEVSPREPITVAPSRHRHIPRKLIYVLCVVALVGAFLGIYFGTDLIPPPNGNGVGPDPDPNIPWLARNDPAMASYVTALVENGFHLSENAQLKVLVKVSFEGEEYSVVRYKSSPFGMQVFDSNIRLVTDESIVRRILTSYAFGHHSNRTPVDDREVLQTVLDQVSQISESGGPIFEANEAIGPLFDYVDYLDGIGLPFVGSVWDVVCDFSTSVCEAETHLRSLHNALTQVESILENCATSLEFVLEAHDQLNVESPDDTTAHTITVDGVKLATNIVTAIDNSEDLKTFAEDIKEEVDEYLGYYYGIESVLQDLGDLVGVGKYVGDFVNLFDRLVGPVEQISDSLGQIKANLDESVDSLTRNQEVASGLQDTAFEQYNYRP